MQSTLKQNWDTGILVSLPHSGLVLPDQIITRIHPQVRLIQSDWYLDQVYDFLDDLAIPYLIQAVNRNIVDLNRKSLKAARSIVPRFTGQGQAIYQSYPGSSLQAQLKVLYYDPYYQALIDHLSLDPYPGKPRLLLDLHSYEAGPPMQVILGNHKGKTCPPWLMEAVGTIFEKNGFRVSYNHPYAGGAITDTIWKKTGAWTLQVELSYASYLGTGPFDQAVNPPIDSEAWTDCQTKLREAFLDLVILMTSLRNDKVDVLN